MCQLVSPGLLNLYFFNYKLELHLQWIYFTSIIIETIIINLLKVASTRAQMIGDQYRYVNFNLTIS